MLVRFGRRVSGRCGGGGVAPLGLSGPCSAAEDGRSSWVVGRHSRLSTRAPGWAGSRCVQRCSPQERLVVFGPGRRRPGFSCERGGCVPPGADRPSAASAVPGRGVGFSRLCPAGRPVCVCRNTQGPLRRQRGRLRGQRIFGRHTPPAGRPGPAARCGWPAVVWAGSVARPRGGRTGPAHRRGRSPLPSGHPSAPPRDVVQGDAMLRRCSGVARYMLGCWSGRAIARCRAAMRLG